jgi:dipeptidyl aminopeptidase/acylaminoacyl peptidase
MNERLVLRGHEDKVWSAAFSPDGQRIVTASEDKTARVWKADGTGEPLVLRGHEDRVSWAAFSPDGQRIVTTSWDKTARVWTDLTQLRGPEEPRLWSATTYCFAIERSARDRARVSRAPPRRRGAPLPWGPSAACAELRAGSNRAKPLYSPSSRLHPPHTGRADGNRGRREQREREHRWHEHRGAHVVEIPERQGTE